MPKLLVGFPNLVKISKSTAELRAIRPYKSVEDFQYDVLTMNVYVLVTP